GAVKLQTNHGVLTGWKDDKDIAEWTLGDVKEGRYQLVVSWTAPADIAGQEFVVRIDGKEALRGKVPATDSIVDIRSRSFGLIQLKSGSQKVQFGPAKTVKGNLINLLGVTLTPEGWKESRGGMLKVPDGFEVEQVAVAPLVQHPMMACLDDR